MINAQIIDPPGPVLVSTHGKATKSFFKPTVINWTRPFPFKGLLAVIFHFKLKIS